jgi:hypothetical protein
VRVVIFLILFIYLFVYLVSFGFGFFTSGSRTRRGVTLATTSMGALAGTKRSKERKKNIHFLNFCIV